MDDRERDPFLLVSGLPRSGTSLMMAMLEAGGLPAFTDGVRSADADNPNGYYELERVKDLRRGDGGWLREAQGRAVKVISELLKHLPEDHRYRVIFMNRDLGEVLASQRVMLERAGCEPEPAEDEKLETLYRRHLAELDVWLARQPNLEVLYLDYKDVVARPHAQACRVNEFLGGFLDEEKMTAAVDPKLYRQRTELQKSAIGNQES